MALVLVAGELSGNGGTVAPVTLELIAAARGLAGEGGKVAAAFMGQPGLNVSGAPVDTVYLLEHAALGEADAGVFDAAVSALHKLASQVKPDVIIFARTDSGSVIAPRLAHRLGAGLARDCTAAQKDANGKVSVTRPVFGGNANGRFDFTGAGPHVIIMRPGANEPETGREASPEVVKLDISDALPARGAKIVRTVQEQKQGVRLEDAEVVVSGGRGLGGPEPFKQITELAELLGGAVGASRAACDAGWIDHSHQVGLTGKSISPRLYITFGISGASQHMAGCSAARNIVAVNSDRDANIFKEARFGVVGDWSKVLPSLIATLRDIK
jgi:electron transfer flavoprotein alpha subunit